MKRALLVLNAGSSSLKFAVYGHDSNLSLRLKGSVSRLGQAPRLKIVSPDRTDDSSDLGSGPMSCRDALPVVFAAIADHGFTGQIATIGHRIVHGGQDFTKPVVLDQSILEGLRHLAPMAPLHQPVNLDMVEMAASLFPQAVQIGTFDTAFHADRPRCDRLYGLPRSLSDDGILAYGPPLKIVLSPAA